MPRDYAKWPDRKKFERIYHMYRIGATIKEDYRMILTTSFHPVDFHDHQASIDGDGNGVTDSGDGKYPHKHQVKGYVALHGGEDGHTHFLCMR